MYSWIEREKLTDVIRWFRKELKSITITDEQMEKESWGRIEFLSKNKGFLEGQSLHEIMKRYSAHQVWV